MVAPVLSTKLHLPPPRPGFVRRPRLVERLHEGLRLKLILIAAPAGFGKSTLLGEWLEELDLPVAWLSLDTADSNFPRFMTYLVAALRTIGVVDGSGVMGALGSAQPPAVESIVTALVNEIAAQDGDFLLVLDDFHLVESASVDEALSFLLEHLPPRMHVAIATREDPHLHVARLRARGQMIELRAADLRFSAAETAEFLHRVMGLGLTPGDVATLDDRTEGWIAGLQLAGLSMRGRNDVAGFIEDFAGDNRYIVDYLLDEVLARQPDHVRSFLLQTSVLERLTGPLCDAVTGQEHSQARLESLERGNYFVIPLDDKRQWYRYHHLFADMLTAFLRAEEPQQLPVLHRRASVWFEDRGAAADAIRHALAAEDYERAADLVEAAAPALHRSRQEDVVAAWFAALPDAVVRARPALCVLHAGTLLVRGQIRGVEERLRDAERWLDAHAAHRPPEPTPTSPNAPATGAENGVQSLRASIAVSRAGCALMAGDVGATMRFAHAALELVGNADPARRGAAAGLLGLAHWTEGDLDAAYAAYAEAMASLQEAGHVADAIGCALALADIRVAHGRLHEAMATYERGLQLATEGGAPVLRGAADMHVGMSRLALERGDVRLAEQHLQRSTEFGELNGLPQNRYRSCVARARLREAAGDLEGALDLLTEADRLYASDFFPNVRPVAAYRARVWIRQRRWGEALGWAREHGVSADDDLTYLREFEHITLARLLVARSPDDPSAAATLEGTTLLERLQRAAEDGARIGSVVEVLVLQALARRARGDAPGALAALERALVLAEPEGFVRVFVDEGRPMVALLTTAAKRGLSARFVRRLLASSDDGAAGTSPSAGIDEPLSAREMEVLRLLGTDLSGPEIARELRVSLNTMRTHTKHVYDKLHVNDRRAAVRRAAELRLL